ncbi:MAG TPA: hypothetical protein VFF54_08430 [Thermodesulfobacteriota bacterium]|nr:hypothetical protein [Thermodesulfobacteriota bacterium]
MTKKEIAARNIGMTFDFIRNIVDNPAAVASVPDGAEVDFIGSDFPLGPEIGTKGKTVARYKVSHVFEQVKR